MNRPALTNNISHNNTAGYFCVCGKCHRRNVRTAKFCGFCGATLSEKNIITKPMPYYSLGINTDRDYELNLHDKFVEKVEKIKQAFHSEDFVYRVVLVSAVLLMFFSGAVSYAFFNATDVVRFSSRPFSDVSLDHPIYVLCPNLLKIHGIGIRKNNNLAPYEDISVVEWNYAANCMANHYNMDIFRKLKIEENEKFDLYTLQERLTSLGFKSDTLKDIKRLNAFRCLEETLKGTGCVI